MSLKVALYALIVFVLSILIILQYGKLIKKQTTEICNNNKDDKPSKQCLSNLKYRVKILEKLKEYQDTHIKNQQWLEKIIIPQKDQNLVNEVVIETVKTVLGDDQRTWTPQDLDKQNIE